MKWMRVCARPARQACWSPRRRLSPTIRRTKPRTWEHQALVRARVVYGDPQLKTQFDAIRKSVMTTPREGSTLQTEVREMREKMRAHLGNKHRDRFDIKADEGGITDIEFITQYLGAAARAR